MSDFDTGNDLKRFEAEPEDDVRPIDYDSKPPRAPSPSDAGRLQERRDMAAPPPLPDDPGRGAQSQATENKADKPGGAEEQSPAKPESNLPPDLPSDPGDFAASEDPQPVRRNNIEEMANAKPEEKTIYEPPARNFITKGDYLDLKEKLPHLNRLIIGAGWVQRTIEGTKTDIDLSCFLIDKTGETRVNEDFVYYNNEQALDGAVKHHGDSRSGAGEGDDESLFVDLNGLPFEILQVVIVLSVYDEKRAGKSFNDVRDIYLRLVNEDDNEEIVRFAPTAEDLKGANAIKAITLVREGPKWMADCQAKTYTGYLNKIATEYGLVIAEDTG